MNGVHAPELRVAAAVGQGGTQPGLLPGAVVQLFLFHGDRYLGWDCFAKDMVLVGGDSADDLTLDGLSGTGTRLVVYVDGRRIVVHDPSGRGAVRVNDEPITTRVLGALDVVTLGGYSLKARLEEIGANERVPWEPETPDAVWPEPPAPVDPWHDAQPSTASEPLVVAAETEPAPAASADPTPGPVSALGPCPQEMFTTPASPVDLATIDSTPPFGLDDPHALELFHALVEQATSPAEEAPVPEDMRAEPGVPCSETEPSPRDTVGTPSAAIATLSEPWAPVTEPGAPAVQPVAEEPLRELPPLATTWTMPKPAFVADDEPDEDEEEDRGATFSLVDLALWNPTPDCREELDGVLLQVARIRAGQLLDLALLDHGQRYRHPTGSRRTCPLARRDKAGRSTLTVSRARTTGEMLLADGRCVPLADLLTPETRVSRRKDLHRVALPQGCQAHLEIDGEKLVIHAVPRRRSPEVAAAPAKKNGLVRNLASSSLVHVVLLMVGSLFLSLPAPEEAPPPETRFVQLDLEQLKPPAPKPAAAKPEPKPAAPVQVAKVAKAKPKPAAAPKPAPKQTKPGANPALASNKGKGPTSAAASPKAGGGHGGNARNRNIKQAGILGALGIPDGINLGASQAMAAVTNIDAVRSTRSSEAGLKVGGIVGSLGSDRVEMPAVGLVNTRGSTQVVVSAGIGGAGTVAALERGVTGETQVRAMVTADIKVPASVSGGMSREEVKRVIDEHMDEISYCYETALIEDAGLMGRMAFEWKILLSGRVGAVNIQSSSIQSDPLHACIKRAIKTWQFPEPRGAEVLVSYPFVFDVVGF